MKAAWLAPIAVLLLLVVVGLLTWRALQRPDPLAEARKGDPARIVRVAAVIESLTDTGSRHNHNAIVAFGLRYAAPDGRALTARIERAVPPLMLSQLAVGKQLLLEVDTLDPAKADLVEPLQLSGR